MYVDNPAADVYRQHEARLSVNFHAACNNKGPTLTIVSAKGKTFGVYISNSWMSAGDYAPGNSTGFLFMLDPLAI